MLNRQEQGPGSDAHSSSAWAYMEPHGPAFATPLLQMDEVFELQYNDHG